METITVYGERTCEDTLRAMAQLDAINVQYDFVDVEQDDQARTRAEALNGGTLRTPTITFGGGGDPLIEPSNEELIRELSRRQLVPLGYMG